MRFENPEWFALIPALLFLGWQVRSFRLWLPLRAICLGLVVLALTNPQWAMLRPGVDLWVLLDRSDSAADSLAPRLFEWESLIRDGAGSDDSLNMLEFASEAVLRGSGETASYSGATGETRLADAIRTALGKRDPQRASRILVLSDGQSTQPLFPVEEALRASGSRLDYRLAPKPQANDVQVVRIDAPTTVQKGQNFLLEAEIAGPVGTSVRYRLLRGETEVAKGSKILQASREQILLASRAPQAGAFEYVLEVSSETDLTPGNNRISRWIEVSGGPRILLISGFSPDPLGAVLAESGFDLDLARSGEALSPGRLNGAKAVIINNVPASELPSDFIEALPFFVEAQGGGLLMLGGKHSFGGGGYFRSPLDPLLPVSMELKEDHKRLAVAMAVVLDRSGSMSAVVSGRTTKMDLANSGAIQSAELLGELDRMTVFAVDSSPHEVVPLTAIGPNRSEITRRVKAIESTGGGIFVYSGLKAAWDELQKAEVGQRHIVLFSDAADSEEPGDYKNLLKEMVDNGASISVIALGSPSDSDAEFLRDIAMRGNGRIFFNSDANDLPRLFAQETVAIARSAFIETATPTNETGGWSALAANRVSWLNEVAGYNLSYLRPDATAALLSKDEFTAPLVAFWQRGAGKAAAVTTPVAGQFGQPVQNWTDAADFFQTLCKWLMGDDTPPGLALFHNLRGNNLELDLYYDESLEASIISNPPRILLSPFKKGEPPLEVIWTRLQPGHFSAQTSIPLQVPVRGAVQAGSHTLQFGPLLAPASEEWQIKPQRVAELDRLAQTSGGGELINFSSVWEAPRKNRFASMRIFILLLLIPIALAEFFFARWQ